MTSKEAIACARWCPNWKLFAREMDIESESLAIRSYCAAREIALDQEAEREIASKRKQRGKVGA